MSDGEIERLTRMLEENDKVTSDIVEKVAKAICASFGGDGSKIVKDPTGLFRLSGSFPQWEFYRPVAEAVISEIKAALSGEYERGFYDCLDRVEEVEKKQAERLEKRMKPIRDALHPGPLKPPKLSGNN